MSIFLRINKYIWPQISKYKILFLGIMFFLFLRTFIDSIIVPVYFRKFIDLLSTNILDRNILSSEIFNIVFIMIFFYFLAALTARMRGFLYLDFMVNIIRDLRNFTFQKIEKNSQTFFSNTFAGSLVTKSRRFVTGFENMFDIFIFNFLTIFIILVGTFVVLIRESLFISFILFGLIFVYMFLVLFFIKKKIKYDILEAEQDSKISGRLADVFGNISAVKFFSARQKEISSFGKYTDEGFHRSRRAMSWSNKIDIFQSFFSFFIGAIVLYILTKFWIDGKIGTGTVVLVETYLTIILVRLWDLSNSLVRFMKSASDMKEMIDIFEIVPDILDPKNGEVCKIKQGHIFFKNVSFKYQMGDEVLSDFNLEIKMGEKVGIVGHSGAGKSTITRLLLRFNDVTNGSIMIDGQDIRNITQDDLRNQISYVPQEPILFHRPILENINYGNINATLEEIVTVAKKAHAHEFISKLSHGYNTLVGERGVKLSGGERQRVAIARAMLKNSPLLILDEATSSLDSISESYIEEGFNELMKGKTTIVIAHRLSTIQKMDRIIVLDKGKIVEDGKHKDLLEKNGFYADLWNHQTGSFLE